MKLKISKIVLVAAVLLFASIVDVNASGVSNKVKPLVKRLEAGEKQTVVVYGTSLTKIGAWPDQLRTVLEQNYPGRVTFINSAKGGSNSVWGKNNFEKKVIDKKPDTLFLEFAINDAVVGRKVSIKQSRENLEDMIDRILKANADCEIILMTMNPPVANSKARRPDVANYYQMYRDVAKERKFQLIDHYPAWEKILHENPGRFIQYVPDGIHPLREGALTVIMPTMIQSLGLKRGKPEMSKRAPCWDGIFRAMDRLVIQNREVTLEEHIKYWEGNFKINDANKDGILKPEEYIPADLFTYVDADNDGSITVAEYQAVYLPLFKNHDVNADGKLVKGEMGMTK